jgi:hypothetical protein
MTDDSPYEYPDDLDPEAEHLPAESGPQSQEIRHSQVSALVPEKVAPGVFSTGAVVLQGGHEFIIDFLLRMTAPHRLAARVVLPPSVIPRLIAALRENLRNYSNRFGPPPSPPMPGPKQQVQQPSAQELYEQLKLPEDVLSGKYANAVMIGHTASEFSFDFITTFFPRSAVSCRVYLSAPNVPRFLEALTHSFEQYQRKLQERREEPPPTSSTFTTE